MKFQSTDLKEVLVMEPKVFTDSRGYFMELFRANVFAENGPKTTYVQHSESRSQKDTIRGLHYQLAPHAQTKIVRVLEGCVIDVAVDIRKGSPTFGQHVEVELSAENKRSILIPRGFAHGFSVLSEYATINYMVDNYYNPESERGIVYNDPVLSINWGINQKNAVISDKDRIYPVINEAQTFDFGVNLYD